MMSSESHQIGVLLREKMEYKQGVTARRGFLPVLPWFLVPYDSLTYLLGEDLHSTSQTLPLTAMFCIPYLLLMGPSLRTNSTSRKLIGLLCGAWAIMMILAVLNLGAESLLSTQADVSMRVPSMLRQGLSMFLGIGSFVMFQDSLLRIGLSRSMQWVIIGAAPCMISGLAQIYTGSVRIQGLSSEPSHMADMLIFAYLPACLICLKGRSAFFIAASLGVLLLLSTFSTTGMIKAAFAMGAFFAVRGQLLRGLFWLAIGAAVGFTFLSLFPDNYLFYIAGYMTDAYILTGNLITGSFIDRFFGFVGPISQLASWHGWLGFGFGGDTVYFYSLFDAETANEIRAVKGDFLSISSLQGKMLMYGGLLGYVYYVSAWGKAFANAPQRHVARFMLPSVFAASIFSLGPIFLPYVWLWLAIGATALEEDFLQR